MRLFALETDLETTKRLLMGKREEEVMSVHRHWLPMAFVAVRDVFIGVVLLFTAVMLSAQGVAVLMLFCGWVVWTFSGLLRAFIEWRYTFLFLTREKVVIIRQHVLRRRLLPITLNNIQSVEVESQYWNLFHFGRIHIHLRDSGEVLTFSYIPYSERVARKLTNVVSMYNQRIGTWNQMSKPPMPLAS